MLGIDVVDYLKAQVQNRGDTLASAVPFVRTLDNLRVTVEEFRRIGESAGTNVVDAVMEKTDFPNGARWIALCDAV